MTIHHSDVQDALLKKIKNGDFSIITLDELVLKILSQNTVSEKEAYDILSSIYYVSVSTLQEVVKRFSLEVNHD